MTFVPVVVIKLLSTKKHPMTCSFTSFRLDSWYFSTRLAHRRKRCNKTQIQIRPARGEGEARPLSRPRPPARPAAVTLELSRPRAPWPSSLVASYCCHRQHLTLTGFIHFYLIFLLHVGDDLVREPLRVWPKRARHPLPFH